MPKQENLYSKYKYIWEQLDNTMDSLFSYIQGYPLIQMDSYGNITVANNDNPDTCPVFCCHLDTVHQQEPELELVKDDVLLSMDGGGVGGDDKCGIVACLELLEKIPCKCIFFRDEESGCKGSNKYDATSLKDNLFCIEIDRRGSSDLIFSACRGQMCSEEFQERVKKAFPHGTPERGSLTDVCVLGAAEINMMNLSAGYYRPHTNKEYVVLSELALNIDCLVKLVNDLTANPLENNKYKRSVISYAYNQRYASGYRTFEEVARASSEKSDAALFPGLGQFDDAGAEDFEIAQYGHRKK